MKLNYTILEEMKNEAGEIIRKKIDIRAIFPIFDLQVLKSTGQVLNAENYLRLDRIQKLLGTEDIDSSDFSVEDLEWFKRCLNPDTINLSLFNKGEAFVDDCILGLINYLNELQKS